MWAEWEEGGLAAEESGPSGTQCGPAKGSNVVPNPREKRVRGRSMAGRYSYNPSMPFRKPILASVRRSTKSRKPALS